MLFVPARCFLTFYFSTPLLLYFCMALTVETFDHEIAEALKGFEKYIICIDKTPDDCQMSLRSLMEKAIKAYEGRAANLRHGIALDKQVTIILSQTDSERPLCGIYFNLFTPYHKKSAGKKEKAGEGS
jgi:hypothetical protein